MSQRIDPGWHKQQVLEYQREQPLYAEYVRVLRQVLGKACAIHAPTAIVDGRPKSIASFAEKAARKADKYDDPVHQLTDLCGLRVIANTSMEMRAVCRFIREHFQVDEANSGDAGGRLEEDEFGYRSVHYIVQVDRDQILGIAIPLDKIRARKAEIQVRTVAQHAWASITHDRLYKSSFHVPSHLKRLAHRSAALLEEADVALNEFEEQVQAYLGSYTAFLSPAELATEITVVSMVLDREPAESNKPAIALRLARLLRASGQLDAAISALEPYTEVTGSAQLPLLVELGSALIDRQQAADQKRGQALLKQVVQQTGRQAPEIDETLTVHEKKLRAAALSMLASVAEQRERRDLFTSALESDPHDPYILCAQLAHNLARTSQRAVLDSARPAILRGIESCRAHVAAGLQLPRAWLTTARLHLMLRQQVDALEQYAKAIRFYLADANLPWREADFQAELEFLKQVRNASDEPLPEVDCSAQLLRLGRWLKDGRSGSVSEAVGRQPLYTTYDSAQPILVICGSSSRLAPQKLDSYRELIKTTLAGFSGTVVTSGTTIGAADLVESAIGELKLTDCKRCRALAYHSDQLPNLNLADAYDEHVGGKHEPLGCGEPLQLWVDLFTAGVHPADVRVLGLHGDQQARFSCALALALGALVGLIESSEGVADRLLKDQDWTKIPTLLPLPNDRMTAHAFAHVGTTHLSADELDRMGQVAHNTYRRGTKPNYKKPNTLPWDVLPDFYRQSSSEQAAYAFHLLQMNGYEIKKQKQLEQQATIRAEQLELLAEMEHGRWNLERLRSGWRRGEIKDEHRKLSPYLVAWKDLPADIRQYDVNAVESFPEILAAGGYQLQAGKST